MFKPKTHSKSDRAKFASDFSSSGVVLSKTGGARKDPYDIVFSDEGQSQLKSVKIKFKSTGN